MDVWQGHVSLPQSYTDEELLTSRSGFVPASDISIESIRRFLGGLFILQHGDHIVVEGSIGIHAARRSRQQLLPDKADIDTSGLIVERHRPMVTLDHEPGEGVPTYLARALVLSGRSGDPVSCVFNGVCARIPADRP